jgi:DNA-binding NtrC family response regulator
MSKKAVIFVVEDDPGFNLLITSYLKAKNKWEVFAFENGEECLTKLNLNPEIFLQDFDLPGINGIEVMKKVKRDLPETEFIFLSAQTNIKIAVEALQLGAFDYIMKDAGAKENALNKIDQILKINKLQSEKQSGKKINSILLGVLSILLMAVIFLFFRA